jgi:hypothetical protein
MTYVKSAYGALTYPYSLEQLCRDNPNMSFPEAPSDELLASHGMYPVTVLPEPTYDLITQIASRNAYPSETNGVFSLGWTVRDKTPVELAAEQAARVAMRVIELKQLLADTDYVALSDYDKDKPEILAQRQVWREEIRTLEAN